MRLQKYMAHCGVASRRKSEELIQKGLVKVNGVVEMNPAYKVQKNDRVTYGGKDLFFEEKKIFKMYKPIKVISTVKDPKKRTTVLDFYQGDERLYPIGRLDYESEGLLLLTNKGDLAQKMTHPKYEVEKVYLVQPHRPLSLLEMQRLEKGVVIDGVLTSPMTIRKRNRGDYLFFLKEGRNRQIRKMLEVLKVRTLGIKRISMGPISIGDLKPGEIRALTPRENKLLEEIFRE